MSSRSLRDYRNQPNRCPGAYLPESSGVAQHAPHDIDRTRGAGLIAHTGRLSAEEADGLAQIVGESWQTSARVAQILGREQLRFEQSVEGGEHMFYSLAVTQDIILSAALGTSMPLGIIRHQAKTTADALRVLIEKS